MLCVQSNVSAQKVHSALNTEEEEVNISMDDQQYSSYRIQGREARKKDVYE